MKILLALICWPAALVLALLAGAIGAVSIALIPSTAAFSLILMVPAIAAAGGAVMLVAFPFTDG